MNASRQKLLLGTAILLWIAAITLGARELWHYSQTPGKLAEAPEVWPPSIRGHTNGRPTLVLFLHPECPCSRATVTELSRLMTRTPRNLEVITYFLQLEKEKWNAETSALWRSVSQLPGVKIQHDTFGKVARTFGVETSGTTLLYDEQGNLRFRGGITGGRGHEGENASEDALLSSLQEISAKPVSRDVFGCSLF